MNKIRNSKTPAERREYLEKKLQTSLAATGECCQTYKSAAGKNCENIIGTTKVPLGIAGPLRVEYQKQTKNIFLPLATTEGALVASVNRGCKAVTKARGAKVVVNDRGMTRAPVFTAGSLQQGRELINWVNSNRKKIKKAAEKTSRHLRFIDCQPFQLGKKVFLRFVFSTGAAMGMNMATIATKEIVGLIEENTAAQCLSLSGNMCTDKKPAWLNFLNGRGKQVWAEVEIDREILHKVLKTTAGQIADLVQAKCYQGSIMSGSMGFNAHYANIISALFIASGQDPAHVVNSSLGINTAEAVNNNLYFSVYLPNVQVGTIGGGTGLPTQQEALKIIKLEPGKKNSAKELSAVIGAAVMAGEISLLSALSSKQLASAHQKLGRKND